MERISGRKLHRDNKGKHTFKRTARMDLRKSELEVQNAEVIDRLVGRADNIRNDFRQLTLSPNHRNAQRARELIEEFTDIKAQLTVHHRVIAPIY